MNPASCRKAEEIHLSVICVWQSETVAQYGQMTIEFHQEDVGSADSFVGFKKCPIAVRSQSQPLTPQTDEGSIPQLLAQEGERRFMRLQLHAELFAQEDCNAKHEDGLPAELCRCTFASRPHVD
ncbi:hypothetical protein OB2597_18207 [Pseudooceanicola batsensis HTCC2597]|uniref:Uncharacterized protein n=1 Tax=Pseudooceanicola batsensis (strain ATCC BAA-863 / DSM 15984 / KCTC 12145 / HTCC2597) TaxID=252305 RepID=A3U045_PSEBH|nr:hypothetical protein OB2597_18207 [Pseudooceanicola batsensis HTCC2597]